MPLKSTYKSTFNAPDDGQTNAHGNAQANAHGNAQTDAQTNGRAQSPVADLLSRELNAALKPSHLEIFNESAMHGRGGESHFKVVVVSQAFSGLSRVRRQQAVFASAGALLESNGGPIHALTMTTATAEEWEAQTSAARVNASPDCQHRQIK